MSKKDKKIFVIIDAYALIHRAYHALPVLNTQMGEPTNAVFGFSSILIRVLKDMKPTHIAAAFDLAEETFRKKEFKEYKAQRKKAPDDLYAQIPRVREVLDAFKIPILSSPGFEGDDIIGTLVSYTENNHPDIENIIVSGDLDTLQLVSDRTKVYTMKKGFNDTILYDEKSVVDRFGFDPAYISEYKGLMGDVSDNIPGVEGVGHKTASSLIARYKTIDVIYDNAKNGKLEGVSERILNKLLESEEEANFSKMLATIRQDVPIEFKIEDASWGSFDRNEVYALFQDLNIRSLVDRLKDVEGFEEDSLFSSKKDRAEEMKEQVDEARRADILTNELYELEKNLIPVIEKMENKGVKIDKEKIAEAHKDIQGMLNKIEMDIYKIAGQNFNINSPAQVSNVLFEVLKIDTKKIKKISTKQYSTSAEQLEKIEGEHPIVSLILKQRELQKLLSTYIDKLPSHIKDDGRIHSKFISLGTSTGRMSSSNPNLQNIPIRGEWASLLRKSFVAEKNNSFLSCDYSQMELRIVAHIAKDENMIDAFNKGEDIHKTTASLVFGVDMQEVNADMRYRAKALNFGIIYGIGSRSFAKSANISQNEAQNFMDSYFAIFRGVAEYMESAKEEARKKGYASTMFGRKRYLPDINSPNPMLRSLAERIAINAPIQGTSADIVKMAMVEADKKFNDIDLVLQIHDELLWEGKEEDIKNHKEEVEKLLENIVDISVPLKVSSHIGTSWDLLK